MHMRFRAVEIHEGVRLSVSVCAYVRLISVSFTHAEISPDSHLQVVRVDIRFHFECVWLQIKWFLDESTKPKRWYCAKLLYTYICACVCCCSHTRQNNRNKVLAEKFD